MNRSFKLCVNDLQEYKKFVYKVVDQKCKEQGKVQVIKFELATEYSFLDYLKNGLQLNMICAIDFTASNGLVHNPTSLHNITIPQNNQYLNALQAVLQILINYDHDQKVATFGFGGNPQMPFNPNNQTLHCFPCNGNPLNPDCQGIQGVIDAYKYSIQNTKLNGPTLFGPIISETMKKCSFIKAQNLFAYEVLLILTDGEIHDMSVVKELIVQAANNLPLSIIIVGIGNANFSNMQILDGDQGLVSDLGVRAQRDIVQFVEMNKCTNPGELAKQVLMELPSQVVQYQKLRETGQI